jgi:hypothetical protein
VSETTTTVVSQPPPPPTMTAAQMIEKYILLRDKKKEIDDANKKRLAPYNLALEQLEALLLDTLNQLGGDSIKTDTGTAYKSVLTSVKVNQWSKTLEYIRDNECWELLEARVSKTAVAAVIEESGAPIPGVTISQETSLNIRRG